MDTVAGSREPTKWLRHRGPLTANEIAPPELEDWFAEPCSRRFRPDLLMPTSQSFRNGSTTHGRLSFPLVPQTTTRRRLPNCRTWCWCIGYAHSKPARRASRCSVHTAPSQASGIDSTILVPPTDARQKTHSQSVSVSTACLPTRDAAGPRRHQAWPTPPRQPWCAPVGQSRSARGRAAHRAHQQALSQLRRSPCRQRPAQRLER
jgi:hypothetical protein